MSSPDESVQTRHRPRYGALEILRYVGPGLLVTVGFIDPGNWAANMAAGSRYGYQLLWVVSLSTLMLVVLQHNVAHLGIVTGLCLAEAANTHLRRWVARAVLVSALLAVAATALAEILGAAIGLNMLFPNIPLPLGAILVTAVGLFLLLSNSYRRLERWIIAFVSLIGLSFIFELSLVHVRWGEAFACAGIPCAPPGSVLLIMSVLGAVVMPHNLFLHSEVIQSRQWNLTEEAVMRRQLRFEFLDTLFSMVIGWAINSAMIIMAATTFFAVHTQVETLPQAGVVLRPLLGNAAATVFAIALLCAGLASSVTAGMASGSIFAGLYSEPYDIKDSHTRWGVVLALVGGLLAVFLVRDPFQGLLVSQMLLSVQLPWTIVLQIVLTSSPVVMGQYVNSPRERLVLWAVALVVAALNVWLLWSLWPR